MVNGDNYKFAGFDISIPNDTAFNLKYSIIRNRYEKSEQKLINKYLIPDTNVIELGGSLGLVSKLITNNFQNKSIGSVLDLGCGTGLFGEEIHHYCKYLEGVDLSNLMLNIAKEKNVYNKLSAKDILDYLKISKAQFNEIFYDQINEIEDFNKYLLEVTIVKMKKSELEQTKEFFEGKTHPN